MFFIADRIEIASSQEIFSDADGHGIHMWTAPTAGHSIQLLPSLPVRARILAYCVVLLDPAAPDAPRRSSA